MKNQMTLSESVLMKQRKPALAHIWAFVFTILCFSYGCQKADLGEMATDDPLEMRLQQSATEQVDLVGSSDEYDPLHIDPSLVNAWGLAFDDEGVIWIAATETGVVNAYDAEGAMVEPSLTVPGGGPTGLVYNTSSQFIIPGTGEPAEWITATVNGTIAAWANGPSAMTVVDHSGMGAVYTGITIGRSMTGQYFLYAADFHNARVDVFDSEFNYMGDINFTDPDMIDGYAPFNIKYIDGQLYVTYAKQLAPDNVEVENGPGNGFVNIFDIDGTFVERFASGKGMNAPWGIAKKPGFQEAILIGNFGSGRIGVYSHLGNFKSFLQVSEMVPVDIQGLWAIEFPMQNLEGADNQRLYFTSGPDHEEEGLFGFLNPVLE